jgi:ferric-dicitrate binding protein FerR (iron transport regulator)
MTSNDKLEDLLKQLYAQEEEPIDTSEFIDEEWQKFEARHFAPKRKSWGWMQIAAAIVGVLMLSGIAYAAISIVHRGHADEVEAPVEQTIAAKPSQEIHETPIARQKESADSIRIFTDMPLDELVGELATYYNKVADIRDAKAHDVRLYYKWNRNNRPEDVVGELNHFDHVNLSIEDDKLIVNH